MDAHVVHLLPASYRGLTASARQLLAAQERWRCRTEVWSLSPLAAQVNPWSLAERRLPTRWPYDPFAQWRLHRDMQLTKPQVIHAWGLPSARYAVACNRLDDGRKLLVSVSEACLAADFPATAWRRRLRSRVDTWLATDEQVADRLRAKLSPAGAVLVIPPGVDCQAPAPRPSSRRRPLRVATIGRLTNGKRFKDLLWAICLLEKVCDALLLLIGDGPQRSSLERYARQTLTKPSVRFLGWRPDARQLAASCDVYWDNDSGGEFNQSLLEAMADGVPSVAVDTPHARTLFEPNENGFLAAPGRSANIARLTKHLLESNGLARASGAAGGQSVRARFPLDSFLAAYRQVYEQVLEQGSRA